MDNIFEISATKLSESTYKHSWSNFTIGWGNFYKISEYKFNPQRGVISCLELSVSDWILDFRKRVYLFKYCYKAGCRTGNTRWHRDVTDRPERNGASHRHVSCKHKNFNRRSFSRLIISAPVFAMERRQNTSHACVIWIGSWLLWEREMSVSASFFSHETGREKLI